MNRLNFKKPMMAAALGATLVSMMTGGLLAAHAAPATNAPTLSKPAKGHQLSFEQRLQHKQANAQAAANARISAAQAVTLVQQQSANLRILGVHYDDGQRPHQAQDKADKPTVVGYRVMAIDNSGQPQHYVVNASTGQITQQALPKRPNMPNKQPPALPTTSIGLAQAMQLAANKAGGKAIGAHIGGHHGKHERHGKQFHDPKNQANAAQATQPMPATMTPSYRVEVVKGQEVYHVTVNAQTGEVSEAVAMKDLPKRHGKAPLAKAPA